MLFSLKKNRAKQNTKLLEGQKLALSGAQLIKSKHFIEHIESIQSLAALPNEHYAIFYQQPLENFLALIQILPIENIQIKLASIVNALKLRRLHDLPHGVKAEDVREYEDIWTYSIFVSSMLYKLPDITAYTISINGDNKSTTWNPYNGVLLPGQNYTIKRHTENNIPSQIGTTLLNVIFNEQAIGWLYSNKQVFNTMLELIQSPDSKTVLGNLIIESHHPINMLAVKKNHIGHDLYRLIEEVIKGNIDSSEKVHNYIHLVHEGYAIAVPDIFKLFSSLKKVNSTEIEDCFYSLNKHKKCTYKVAFPNIGKKHAVILTGLHSSIK